MYCCIRRSYLAFLSLLFLLLAGSLYAGDKPPLHLVLDPESPHNRVYQGVEYLIEKPGQPLTLEQLTSASAWQYYAKPTVNFRREKNPIWLRLPVANNSFNASSWILKIDWPLLDVVSFNAFDLKQQRWMGEQHSGELLDLNHSSNPHVLHLFTFTLPAKSEYYLYLRVQSHNTVLVPMEILEQHYFQRWDKHNDFMLGAFFGILLVMICYNACLFIAIRDLSYLYYCWYVGGILLFELVVTGAGSYYLWGNSSWLKYHSFGLSATFAFLGATLFVRHFMSVKFYGGWVRRVNDFCMYYWGGAFLLAFFNEEYTASIQDLMAMFSCIAGLVTTVYLWTRGNVSARYFTLAWTFIILATFYFAASVEGLIPRTSMTQYSQMIGFVLEVILLSFALAERFNRERAAAQEAQRGALMMSQKVAQEREEKVQAQKAMIELQQKTNEELELRVVERTAVLQDTMHNLERANAELAKLSDTDGLTQVGNRRLFDKTLENEWKRAIRNQQPLSLLLVDIDHFKQVNDTYGHLVGDDCLRYVSLALSRKVTRCSDLVARFGGEEFAILLPSTVADGALEMAESIRREVEAIRVEYAGQQIGLSVSIGVACQSPQQGASYGELISAADTALYQAKGGGRNRAMLAQAM